MPIRSLGMTRFFIIFAAVALVGGVALVALCAATWSDSVPAWLSGIGGILGALASLYAITIAVQADTEHVAWRANVAKTTTKGTPSSFQAVNLSKATVANLMSVEDITGDQIAALDFHLTLPVEVPPGTGVPMGVSRTVANSSLTLVRLTWTERRVRSKRGAKRQYDQVLYL